MGQSCGVAYRGWLLRRRCVYATRPAVAVPRLSELEGMQVPSRDKHASHDLPYTSHRARPRGPHVATGARSACQRPCFTNRKSGGASRWKPVIVNRVIAVVAAESQVPAGAGVDRWSTGASSRSARPVNSSATSTIPRMSAPTAIAHIPALRAPMSARRSPGSRSSVRAFSPARRVLGSFAVAIQPTLQSASQNVGSRKWRAPMPGAGAERYNGCSSSRCRWDCSPDHPERSVERSAGHRASFPASRVCLSPSSASDFALPLERRGALLH